MKAREFAKMAVRLMAVLTLVVAIPANAPSLMNSYQLLHDFCEKRQLGSHPLLETAHIANPSVPPEVPMMCIEGGCLNVDPRAGVGYD